jgi:hypothetical protein
MEDVLVIMGANQHLVGARGQSFTQDSERDAEKTTYRNTSESISVGETIVRPAFSSLRLFALGTPKESIRSCGSGFFAFTRPHSTLSPGFHVATAKTLTGKNNMNLSTAFALTAFIALSKVMGVTTSSTYGTIDSGKRSGYPEHYEDCIEPLVEVFKQSTYRTEFTGGSLTTVRGWPSTGGFYILSCDGVELEFLGLDRFEPTPRSQDAAEEDVFCARMRRLGPRWYPDLEEEALEDFDEYRTKYVKAFGWPADGGVWALKMCEMDAYFKGMSRIRNAFSMDERCRQIEKLGGVFYSDPAKCPDLDLA